MSSARETCWTLIQSAACGRDAAREDFARRYLPVVRAYLSERWRATYLADEVDDAIQEVFLECFRESGALEHADRAVTLAPESTACWNPLALVRLRRGDREAARTAARRLPGAGVTAELNALIEALAGLSLGEPERAREVRERVDGSPVATSEPVVLELQEQLRRLLGADWQAALDRRRAGTPAPRLALPRSSTTPIEGVSWASTVRSVPPSTQALQEA